MSLPGALIVLRTPEPSGAHRIAEEIIDPARVICIVSRRQY